MTPLEAAERVEGAMQLDDVAAARPLVQSVNVLGHDQQLLKDTLHRYERSMTAVRLDLPDRVPPAEIPAEHALRMAAERLASSKFSRIVAGPETCQRIAKGRHARFPRHPRPGQDNDAS
jgi:hypothetical protein